MDGFLDGFDQAFLKIDFGQGPFEFQIDTGFSGTFVVGKDRFATSRATPSGTIEATLAAGQSWTFECYDVPFDWLGKKILAQVLIGPGKECLIGTALLAAHRLEVDYGQRTVELMCSPDW